MNKVKKEVGKLLRETAEKCSSYRRELEDIKTQEAAARNEKAAAISAGDKEAHRAAAQSEEFYSGRRAFVENAIRQLETGSLAAEDTIRAWTSTVIEDQRAADNEFKQAIRQIITIAKQADERIKDGNELLTLIQNEIQRKPNTNGVLTPLHKADKAWMCQALAKYADITIN